MEKDHLLEAINLDLDKIIFIDLSIAMPHFGYMSPCHK